MTIARVVVVCASVPLAAGCGVTRATTTTARTTTIASPCATVAGVAAWSPNGRRFAFIGDAGGQSAICVADSVGGRAEPLRNTICVARSYCFSGSPTELYWVRPEELLYGDPTRGILLVKSGRRPLRLGPLPSKSLGRFAVDAAGDRVAYGISTGSSARGLVEVIQVPSGKLVGRLGPSQPDYSFAPTLSPDGSKVAFTGTSGHVWLALATGHRLRDLKQCAGDPLWSPRGPWIVCRRGLAGLSLMLVSLSSGRTTTIVRGIGPANGVRELWGWSPDGKHVVFVASHCACKLDVVDVRTDRVHELALAGVVTDVAWSPDSRRLLVTRGCELWLISADRGRPRRLFSCS